VNRGIITHLSNSLVCCRLVSLWLFGFQRADERRSDGCPAGGQNLGIAHDFAVTTDAPGIVGLVKAPSVGRQAHTASRDRRFTRKELCT
jgi:hypothetical protein